MREKESSGDRLLRMTWSERQEQKDWLIKRQRIKERRRAGCLALNLSLTCLFLLSAPSLHSSLPLYRSLSDPSLSTCFSPSLACFPLLVSTPYSAPARSHWSSIYQSQQNRGLRDCICKMLLNIHELLSGL